MAIKTYIIIGILLLTGFIINDAVIKQLDFIIKWNIIKKIRSDELEHRIEVLEDIHHIERKKK